MKPKPLLPSYEGAQEQYATLGIDTEQVLEEMQDFHLGLPCRPTDDIDALRSELLEAMQQLPGTHRVALNLSCLDAVEDWIEWAHRHHIKLDFDATLPQADTLTLAHPNNKTRASWVDTLRRCREAANAIGETQQSPCVVNIPIDDGSTDFTVERSLYRDLLSASLDQIFDRNYRWMRDSLKPCKANAAHDTNGNGTEDFCLGYAVANRKMITLDSGRCDVNATKMADKVSAILCHLPGAVLLLTDNPKPEIFHEVVRSGSMRRVQFALDGSALTGNYVERLVSSARTALQCMLQALLEPIALLHTYEINGYRDEEIKLFEKYKTLPWSRIYQELCER